MIEKFSICNFHYVVFHRNLKDKLDDQVESVRKSCKKVVRLMERRSRMAPREPSQSKKVDALPGSVLEAVQSTRNELRRKEGWVPILRGPGVRGISSLITIALAAHEKLSDSSKSRKVIRQGILKILAYLPADSRIVALIDLAALNPHALDDILIGRIDERHEAYRYNVMTSLGIFARHGLINEVLTNERLDLVSSSLGDVRKRMHDAVRKTDSKEE